MSETAEPHVFDAPTITVEALPFFDACTAGKLLIGRCLACNEPHFYPRNICPTCWGPTRFEEASGEGVIYTYSVMRLGDRPYAIGLVSLNEGPVMLTNFVDVAFDRLAIGLKVRITFRPSKSGQLVPVFAPA